MTDCLHRPLCPNECPCEYYAGPTKEYTTLVTDFGGNYVMYSHCDNCGQPVQYPTERPYSCCPYCGMKVIYDV